MIQLIREKEPKYQFQEYEDTYQRQQHSDEHGNARQTTNFFGIQTGDIVAILITQVCFQV